MKRVQVEQASIAWVVFWGLIALDSAIAYRKSVEAVERAIDADPVAEMYDGPPDQVPQVNRWLLWLSPSIRARSTSACRWAGARSWARAGEAATSAAASKAAGPPGLTWASRGSGRARSWAGASPA